MVSKAVFLLLGLFAAIAVTHGNPAAGVPWRWLPRSPTIRYDESGEAYFHIPGTSNVVGQPRGLPEPKIVGGYEAEPHSFPWQIALFIDNSFFCGGVLISEEWVMTAGHCMHGARFVDVTAGAHNIQETEPTQLSQRSRDITMHPKWNANMLLNDISLIKLKNPWKFTDAIAAATIPSEDAADMEKGEPVTPSGWGQTGRFEGQPDKLHAVNVTIAAHKACSDYFGSMYMKDNSVCIDTTGGHGACYGDSGGPLNHFDGQGWEVRGLTSYGPQFCKSGHPGVFTKVAKYRSWIKSVTGV